MAEREIVLVVVDVRSAHNVGSLLRTADAMDVGKVYLVGITPYPAAATAAEPRLPHHTAHTDQKIHKTALGAENAVASEHIESSRLPQLLKNLKDDGYVLLALEQSHQAIDLNQLKVDSQAALIVGNELSGLENIILKTADTIVSIPMLGRKESLNVAIAAGIALYHLRHL